MIFSCLRLFSPLYLLFYSSPQVFSRHSLIISVDLLCGCLFVSCKTKWLTTTQQAQLCLPNDYTYKRQDKTRKVVRGVVKYILKK